MLHAGAWPLLHVATDDHAIHHRPGQYELDKIDLWMPGTWQNTIEATDGTTTDKAVFTFCLSS